MSETLRSDAVRNRDAVLGAARTAFATEAKPSLEAIARSAGVGIGTLYRHFPTREALVAAVYETTLDELRSQGAVLLADLPPDRAMRRWMDLFAEFIAVKREMGEALRGVHDAGGISVASARERLAGGVQEILDAGAAAGTLRPAVEAGDVIASLIGIGLAAASPEQSERMLDLLMAGLRPG